MKTQVLKVGIEDGELVIRIGVDILAIATTASPEFEGRYVATTVKVTDSDEWARAVLHELVQEEEDGTTPVHLMLDTAFKRAWEEGAEGIENVPDSLGEEY